MEAIKNLIVLVLSLVFLLAYIVVCFFPVYIMAAGIFWCEPLWAKVIVSLFGLYLCKVIDPIGFIAKTTTKSLKK